jgi:hypothetical protein
MPWVGATHPIILWINSVAPKFLSVQWTVLFHDIWLLAVQDNDLLLSFDLIQASSEILRCHLAGQNQWQIWIELSYYLWAQ